ncbi:hypothetical protein ACP4OV_014151 [Aristida adscensionis]
MERETAKSMAAAAGAEPGREARGRGTGSAPPPPPPAPAPAPLLAVPRRALEPTWIAAPPPPPPGIRVGFVARAIAPPGALAFRRAAGPPPPPPAIVYVPGHAVRFPPPPRDDSPYQIYVTPGYAAYAAAPYPTVVQQQPRLAVAAAAAYQPVYVWAPAGATAVRGQPVYGWPASMAMRSTSTQLGVPAAAARPSATLHGGPPRPPTIAGVGEAEPEVGDNFTGAARRGGSTSSAAGRGAGSGAQ